MSKNQHQARKRFGQNFLCDVSVVAEIIKLINPQNQDHLVEIGPGFGAITQELLSHCQQLDALEIDRDLTKHLQLEFSRHDNFILHNADALQVELNSLRLGQEKLRIVGNLPYNISTPLLFHLLKQIDCINDMHFMLQKEVVERIAATPGNKNYGRLSLMVQYHCAALALLDIPPSAFQPAPKVISSIIRLTPHAQLPFPADDFAIFSRVVHDAFNQRRKTIANSLKHLTDKAQLTAAGIDPRLRPEQLSLENYVSISNYVSNSN